MKDLKNAEIGDYFKILWRRRWYAVITAILVSSAVFVYARRMPNQFRSYTRIAIENPLDDYMRSVLRTTPEERINYMGEQLRSRTFLERLIVQLQMFGYGTQPDFVMEAAVDSFREKIKVEKTSSNTFTLSFTATDPQVAQMVARRLVNELIQTSSASRKDKVIATDQFIEEQLSKTAKLLSLQEERIQQFKTRHLGELPEQSSANLNALSG